MCKCELRRQKTDFRNALTSGDVQRRSNLIADQLFSLPEFKSAQVVVFYCSIDNEVRTSGMLADSLKMGKRIAIPYCTDDMCLGVRFVEDLERDTVCGAFGICEPIRERTAEVAADAIDAILVPGVVFARNGTRIGRGKGYYDRFLATVRSAKKIALCYDEQLVDSFDGAEHDIPMDIIVTDKRIVKVDL